MLILNLGRRRVGKTTLAYKQSKSAPTIVIFDPRGQFKTSGVILYSAEGLYARLDDTAEITVRPLADVKAVFDQVCEIIKRWTDNFPEESIAFLVDESYFIDTPNEDYPAFDSMLRFSGSKQIKIIMTAHRPKDISVSIHAIADYICIFRMTQQHDLKIIDERCGRDVVEIVKKLEPRQYVMWDDGTATYEVFKDPSKWYISLEPSTRSVVNA